MGPRMILLSLMLAFVAFYQTDCGTVRRGTVSDVDMEGRAVDEGKAELTRQKVEGMLSELREKFSVLRELREEALSKGIPTDYEDVTLTVIENFIPFMEDDLEHGRTERAFRGTRNMLSSAGRAISALRSYLEDPSRAPRVPRYRSGRITIDGTSFLADVRWPDGRIKRRPVFFNGYGHFGQVRRDLGRFPYYGINIIQVEFGPNSVVVGEDEISYRAVEEFIGLLKRAEENNVAVNLLLSPHYFPGWALEKYPHLRDCEGGFIKFCIDAPEARAIEERFLRTVIPRLKGYRALHSFCLSNEPIYVRSDRCPVTRKMWADYLKETHGSIGNLNAAYGTDFGSFSDVPIPGPRDFSAPQFYDWCVFNQRRFSNWHRWMADIIHEYLPEVPVHAKIMPIIFNRDDIAYGVDPEQFCELSQINGNDCWVPYPGEGEWAQNWQTQNMFYDLLRSMKHQPIFNSENHLIRDRDTGYYPPSHIRTALWQGAIHGQGATTIWVWERTHDPRSDFAESIMHRPGCAEAVGRVNLDLQRLSAEVTALKELRAPVAILYSIPSIVHSPKYLDDLKLCYRALNFCGVKIDFISEQGVLSGKLADYRLLVLPSADYVTEGAFRGIGDYIRSGGRTVVVGNALGFDEYGRVRRRAADVLGLGGVTKVGRDTGERELRDIFMDLLGDVGGAPPVNLLDAETGRTVWGIEWLVAELDGDLIVNAVDLTREPRRVRFEVPGTGELKGVELITGREIGAEVETKPLEPVLVKFRG